MPYYISPPPQNPLTRIITAILVAIALTSAFMIGMVALLFVAGAGLLAGLAIWARIVWIKHRLRKQGFNVDVDANPGNNREASTGDVIDAEYTVISKHED